MQTPPWNFALMIAVVLTDVVGRFREKKGAATKFAKSVFARLILPAARMNGQPFVG